MDWDNLIPFAALVVAIVGCQQRLSGRSSLGQRTSCAMRSGKRKEKTRRHTQGS